MRRMSEQPDNEPNEVKSGAVKQSVMPPPSGVTERIGEALAAESLLAVYIDRMAPDSFTDEAKAAMLAETKQYSVDLRNMTQIRQRADRNAEKALKRHVLDSPAALRRQVDSPSKIIANWVKSIGLPSLGWSVQH